MRFGRSKFTCKNHPWDWASPCDGLCTGTWGPTGGAVACPSSFATGGCWLGGTWHPQSCSSAQLAISALPPSQSQSSLAKNPAEVGMKTL